LDPHFNWICLREAGHYLALDADDRKTLRANLADSPLIQDTGYDRMQHPGKLSSETIRLIGVPPVIVQKHTIRRIFVQTP
jgi:hypothetical protein